VRIAIVTQYMIGCLHTECDAQRPNVVHFIVVRAVFYHVFTTVRAEHESRINDMVQLHDRQLQQLQSTTAAARQQDATTISQQLTALDTEYTATVTGLREALKQTRAKLKQLLSNSSGTTGSGTASHRGATTASSRARY
jgi:beta-phosphoglucomutase-like phosphatase (HAD superfamily)